MHTYSCAECDSAPPPLLAAYVLATLAIVAVLLQRIAMSHVASNCTILTKKREGKPPLTLYRCVCVGSNLRE